MRFSVLIPARMASSRLPDKPLADIAGKPMVVRVAERAAASGADRVVVACDDERIASACAAHGVDSVLTRADHPSGSDRLAFPIRDGIPVMLESEAMPLDGPAPAAAA